MFSSGYEFAKIEKPWYKKPWMMIPLVSTVLMFLLKDRMAPMSMSSAVFLWLVGNMGILLAVASWEAFKYHSEQVVASNIHGSFNPQAIHPVGNYYVLTVGSFVSDVGAPRKGDYTVVIPKELLMDIGNNKIIWGTPTPCYLEELPLEVQEFIRGVPYCQQDVYLYTEIPLTSNPIVKVSTELGEISGERLNAYFRSMHSLVTTMHKLFGMLERGAISVVDFLSTARRLFGKKPLLEIVTKEEEKK